MYITDRSQKKIIFYIVDRLLDYYPNGVYAIMHPYNKNKQNLYTHRHNILSGPDSYNYFNKSLTITPCWSQGKKIKKLLKTFRRADADKKRRREESFVGKIRGDGDAMNTSCRVHR